MSIYKKSNRAFTLAEVLVTLGIVGVVSALTIPTLVKNHKQKLFVTQLHKVYNDFTQATEMYMTDKQVANLAESRLRNNPAELRRFFNSYFKVVKDCETSYVPCFADEYTSMTGNGPTRLRTGQCNVVITLASGAAICADVAHMEDSSYTNDEGQEETVKSSNHVGSVGDVIAIEVDVNGKQPPNMYGRDYFAFQINRNGRVIDKFYNPNVEIDTDAANPNTGMFGKIVDDGWQMNY